MSWLLDKISGHSRTQTGRPALAGAGFTVPYPQLPALILETASQLAPLLPGEGSVAVQMDNSPAMVLIDLALDMLQRVHVPLPPFFTSAQSQHALMNSGASCVITPATQNQSKLRIADTAIAVHRLTALPVRLPEGTAKITFTSGSTGNPKGVCLTRAMQYETANAIVAALGAETAGVHLALLPHAVLLENVAGLYAVLVAGGTYHAQSLKTLGFAQSFAPDFLKMAQGLAAAQASTAIVVPELLRGLMMVAAQGFAFPDLKFLAVGGATVSPGLLHKAQELGLPVYEGYGMSETGSVISLNTPAHHRAGTAGRLLAHVEAEIADDGELLIRRPIFAGYAGGEAAPELLATGDVVAQDEEGYLRIIGRKLARIITSFGRNISPEWVERELLAQAAIAQVLVVGEGAASLSALVVPRAANIRDADIAAAITLANASLPDYAQVKNWQIVPPFTPDNGQLTSNGRPRRHVIQQLHAALIAKLTS